MGFPPCRSAASSQHGKDTLLSICARRFGGLFIGFNQVIEKQEKKIFFYRTNSGMN
jgi:hypothetical protein